MLVIAFQAQRDRLGVIRVVDHLHRGRLVGVLESGDVEGGGGGRRADAGCAVPDEFFAEVGVGPGWTLVRCL